LVIMHMTHKLSATEIAEGALLADIAVLLQLVALYLPIADVLVRFLIPIVFAVLVLRRGLYAGLLSLAVACFVVAALSGLAIIVPMALSCGAGLFLGQTMRWRLRHLPLLFLGATGGTLALVALVVVFTLLAGVSLATIGRQLERSYQAGMALGAWLAAWFGYAGWWEQAAVPALEPLAHVVLAYWWAALPVLLWLSLLPVVILVYFTTNAAVRLLGYDVRPFPGGRTERLFAWGARRLAGLRRRSLR
jgi:hypothetical protein